MSDSSKHHRILLVDDTLSIHDDIRLCLRPQTKAALATEMMELFGSSAPGGRAPGFSMECEFESAYQGQEALAKVEEAMRIGRPFSLAFVDIRMPPGWDGIETVERLWKVDPNLEVILCTAYSDYSWQEIAERLQHNERFLILKKPFDGLEVQQLAVSLTTKSELRLSLICQIEQLQEAVQQRSLARRAAERASAAKTEFLANMSHEIRTPLNGVVGMLELLNDTQLQNEQLLFVRGAQASADCLLSLVNDILDFSKIEAGKIELDPFEFNLHQLIEDVAEILAPRAEQKGIEICCDLAEDLPVNVISDGNRIRQVLLNLAGNAVKFTEKGQVVLHAQVEYSDETGTKLQFEVRDSGIGISEESKSRLFHVFTQGDSSTTRRYGGTGLGLALSKRLVDLLGVKIGVDRGLGVGSTFRFTTLVKPLVPAIEQYAPPKAFENLRVLLVDSNDTNLGIMRNLLARWGIDSGLCTQSAEALTELRAARASGRGYGLAIINIQMPGMNSPAFVRQLKTLPEFAHLPIIMLIPLGQAFLRDHLTEIGFTDFLVKPVRQSRLFDVIASALTAKSEEAAPAPVEATRSQAKVLNFTEKSRVLVAEDNEMNQQVIRAYLKRLGFDWMIVGSGTEALQQTRSRGYDLVLMDWQMPDMNGIEATRQIRICEQFAGGLSRSGNPIPVIGVTAHAATDDRNKCIEAGMDDYLTKPISFQALTTMLDHYLSAAPGRDAAVAGQG